MQTDQTIAVILAAGKGTRMKSNLPKVLHTIQGIPLLDYVLRAVKKIANLQPIYVIVGHQADQVKQTFKHHADLRFVEQTEQLGTGHAVMQAAPYLKNKTGRVLLLCGDTPLLTSQTLENLIYTQKSSQASAVVLTADYEDPGHYGRILRAEDGDVRAIREYRDCTEAEREIKEINAGVYCFDLQDCLFALQHLQTNNDQHEYYLTDTLEILRKNGKIIKAFKTDHPEEIQGINTIQELEEIAKSVSEK